MGGRAKITLERAYGEHHGVKGYRVLVDRLWPRGVRKSSLKLDLWAKDVAPSTALRRWFGHEVEKWATFRRRYLAELRRGSVELDQLVAIAKNRPLVLIFGAKDEQHTHAAVLRDFLLRAVES